MRDMIFISYSHADRPVVEELQSHLSLVLDQAHIVIWDDTRITPSSRWRDEIKEALSTSAAAVLFLSQSFFASNFIAEHELPVLLEAADRSEIKIFPVIVTSCN